MDMALQRFVRGFAARDYRDGRARSPWPGSLAQANVGALQHDGISDARVGSNRRSHVHRVRRRSSLVDFPVLQGVALALAHARRTGSGLWSGLVVHIPGRQA